MIVELVMNVLKSFLLFVIGLFPTLPDMSWLSRSLSPVVGVLSGIDRFIDLGTFVLCMIVLFAISNIEFVWGIIMWVIRKIPGVS